MKLAHFHLKDPYGGKSTLVCLLTDGAISYKLWTGWNSSGMGESLSNLGADLPLSKATKNETTGEFRVRLREIIDRKSVRTVEKIIPNKIIFSE